MRQVLNWHEIAEKNMGIYNIQSKLKQIGSKMSHNMVKYAKITFQKRIELIRLIEAEKYTISGAAKEMNIKDSTARAIYKKYKDENIIFETKKERFERKIIQEYERKVQQEEAQNKKNQEGQPIIEFINQFQWISFDCTYPQCEFISMVPCFFES